MASVGGSVKEITFDGRPFSIASDADATINFGGTKATPSPNGDGTARYLGAIECWSVGGLDVAIDHDKGDAQFLKAAAKALVPKSFTIEFIDGTVYNAKGLPADDSNFSTQKAIMGLTFGGEGELTPQ